MKLFSVVMQRDEDQCLEPWLIYHSYLFGSENICVVDHGSVSGSVLSTLRHHERLGVNVVRLPESADYKDKGRFVVQSCSLFSNMTKGDFFFPIDCDEFLVLDSRQGPVCDRDAITKYLESIVDRENYFSIEKNFINVPIKPGYFIPASYKKVFFKGGDCALLDHGSHSGMSSNSYPQMQTDLAYLHFHYKSFEKTKKLSAQKLAPWVDCNDIEALRSFSGPGHHLVRYFFMSEDQFYGSLLSSQQIYSENVVKMFSQLQIDLEFCRL